MRFMRAPDLNLLRLFDTLYEERSVTRAAARLSLTQSAVSHALGRLRDAFEDDLFTRGPGGLLPTARANELAPRIHDILVTIRDAFAPAAFDPATSERSFTIAGGQYFARLIFPRLVAQARMVAPNIVLRLVAVDQALADDLDEGVVDLAVGAFEQVAARFLTRPLLEEEIVWAAAADHPRIAAFDDPAALLAEKRVDIVVDYAAKPLRANRPRDQLARRWTSEDLLLAGHEERQRGPQVYDAATALAIAAMTDFIAVAPRRLVRDSAHAERLRVFPAPEPGPAIPILLLWHRRFDADPGGKWLRDLVTAVAT
jgi:DNA-binding transcriptional LysR family regulator